MEGVNEIIGKQKNKPEVYSLAVHCVRLKAANAGGRDLISHMLCEMLPKINQHKDKNRKASICLG